MSADQPTIGELVARKRAAGYDPEFEARLVRVWSCPHCGHRCRILDLLLPGPSCPACERDGIGLLDTRQPTLAVIDGGQQ